MYHFFYDETEHSRKINYQTITASNYYDNFISVIVGWLSEDEDRIKDRYLGFETKYEFRKVNGELKSQTMKARDLRLGFASLNKNTVGFYDDLISLYDENIIIYLSVASKIEHIINQLLRDYHNNALVNTNYMKYSIIKTINVYRPQKLIEAIYSKPQVFIDELRSFLKNQIAQNQTDIVLKERENQAYKEILMILDDAERLESLEWTYFTPFDGFRKLLIEMNIEDYQLIIDRDGDGSHTLNTALYEGLQNVSEKDSKDYVGIRMADMLAGLISKLMQSLKLALTNNYKAGEIKKTLLDSGWFSLNQKQLDLYKKLYRVICENNNYWYQIYSGIYSDDLVSFVALLQFMNHFEDATMIRNSEVKMLPEYYNAFVCERLQERYSIIRNI